MKFSESKEECDSWRGMTWWRTCRWRAIVSEWNDNSGVVSDAWRHSQVPDDSSALIIARSSTTESFIHSSIHPSIHPFIHSCIHPSILPPVHSLMHSSMHSSIHPPTHSFTHAFIHSSIHPFIPPSLSPPLSPSTISRGRLIRPIIHLSPPPHSVIPESPNCHFTSGRVHNWLYLTVRLRLAIVSDAPL